MLKAANRREKKIKNHMASVRAKLDGFDPEKYEAFEPLYEGLSSRSKFVVLFNVQFIARRVALSLVFLYLNEYRWL